LKANISKQVYEQLIENLNDFVLTFSPNQDLMYLNKAARIFFENLTVGESNWNDLIVLLGYPGKLQEEWELSRLEKEPSNYASQVKIDDQNFVFKRKYIWTKVKDEEVLTLVIQDNTEFDHMQSQLTYNEFFDKSTGLLHKNSFEVVLEMELEKIRRTGDDARLAIMSIEIQDFEYVINLIGESHRLVILEHLGSIIRSSLRANDLLFHFEGQQFVAIISNFTWQSDLMIVAQRISDAIGTPLHAEGNEVVLNMSIGISTFPTDGTSPNELLNHSHIAKEVAKEKKERWRMYDSTEHDRASYKLKIRSDLNKAIREQELSLLYMPIVDKDHKVAGVEAIVRWNHPEFGMLKPNQYIPIAEHSKLITAITRWVLLKSIKQFSYWKKQHNLFLSLNFSSQDFEDESIQDFLKQLMGTDVSASDLRIEISDYKVLNKESTAYQSIKSISNSGAKIILDNFGINDNALVNLPHLQSSSIKIDKSLFNNSFNPEKNLEAINHLIQLGKLWDMQILIDGIEEDSHFNSLINSGADYFQGSYFSEAVPSEIFSNFLLSGGTITTS
jgi:diguanylate cyclase (GGDEF)-like protein